MATSCNDQIADDRAEKISRDLANGIHECVICHDGVNNNTEMWSCKDCFTILHFTCAQQWARAQNSWSWPCPICKNLRQLPLVPRCWCGKNTRIAGSEIIDIDNSCGLRCRNVSTCGSLEATRCTQLCDKICHPGPCTKIVCQFGCISKSVGGSSGEVNPAMPQQPRPFRATNPRFAHSTRQAPEITPASIQNPPLLNGNSPGELTSGRKVPKWLLVMMLMISLDRLVSYYCIERDDWYTNPLKFIHFTIHKQKADLVGHGIVIAIIMIISLSLGFIGASFGYMSTTKWFKIDGHRSRFLRKTLVFVSFVGAFAAPQGWFLWYLWVGPEEVWQDMMSRSCEGFDTRVQLDTGGYAAPSIHLYDPKNNTNQFPFLPNVDTFTFTNDTDPNKGPADAFHAYHRMNGTLAPNLNIVIDFDLRQNIWRAISKSGSATTVPLTNGSWTQTNPKNPHVRLPELNLVIPSMHYFTKHCYFEPFMIVYSTKNLSEDSIKDLTEGGWDQHNQKEVVMRTASMGHGIGKLEVCAKRKGYEFSVEVERKVVGQKKEKVHEIVRREGMGDDVVVPLGLMAVLRRQMMGDWERDGRKKYPCGRGM